MKRTLAMLFVVLALAVGMASAQAKPGSFDGIFRPYVVGTISNAPGASTQNYTVGGGIESNTKHFLFDGSGVYSTALVTADPGNGHVGRFELQGYYKLLGHVLAGGGATAVLNTGDFRTAGFVNKARTAANPFVGAGLQFGRVRSILSYQLTSKNGDAVQEQIKFSLNSELALTRHLRIVVPVDFNSYQTAPFKSLGGQRVSLAQAGAGIKVVF